MIPGQVTEIHCVSLHTAVNWYPNQSRVFERLKRERRGMGTAFHVKVIDTVDEHLGLQRSSLAMELLILTFEKSK